MFNRREFLQVVAAVGGMSAFRAAARSWDSSARMIYDPPRFGNLSLLQIGDTHGQLLPAHVREASVNMGIGEYANRPPFLVGEDFCEHFGIMPQTIRAHAHTHLYFEELSREFGPTGGYAHLATVLKGLRASRPDSLLLDSGDSWMGSGLALMTRGQAMIEATRELQVDAMTGDWEFALGSGRLKEALSGTLAGRTAFLAQNVHGLNGTEPDFQPYAIFIVGGTPVAVIGEAYPHIGESGRPFNAGLTTGIDEVRLQFTVNTARGRGAKLVVLLSHAGLLADMKLAHRVAGIDVILSGHSHDALPVPMIVPSRRGRTLVSSVGAHGKFVGLLDLDLRDGRIRDYRFRLIPVFSRLIPADSGMNALIAKVRGPHAAELDKPLGTSDSLFYRRDTFMGSFDQMVLRILLETQGADIAMGPGYRWGTTVLPGEKLTFERIIDPLAVPNAGVTVESLTGERIRARIEEALDGVFNPDPYLQSGEDLVRVLGLNYRVSPEAPAGRRVGDATVRGKPLESGRSYRVASWGLSPAATPSGQPVWRIVSEYLSRSGRLSAGETQLPSVVGVDRNRGVN